MNAHPMTRKIPEARRLTATQNFSCSLAGAGRLLSGAVLLLLALLAGGRGASAQTITNCLTVICPPPVVTNYICGDVFTPTGYPIIVSNNCPAVAFQVNCNPPPGTPLGLGTHPINCVLTAGGVVVAQCAFTIVVIRDTVPPVIQCPTNLVVRTCPTAAGGCLEVVNYPAPFAADNSGQVAVSCNPPSGSAFPCGATVVTCTAFDRCQNAATCTFTVTVQPNGQLPSITCPPDLTLTKCSNTVVVTYPPPVVVPAGTTVVCVPPSGAALPAGSHTVTCTASNACGVVSCAFKVNVIQVPPPDIQCPTTAITATLPCGSNCVPVVYPAPIVTGGVLVGCSPPSGTCLPVGDTLVICRATNICGQLAGCEFVVHVIQGQGNPPSITCPSNIVVTTCSNSATACIPVSYAAPVVVNGTLLGCLPASGSCFPIGVTTVVCRATNACGSATCSFVVEVRPVPPPTILCSTTTVLVQVPCGSNCVPIAYPLPVVSNGVLMGCTPPSGTCLPVGNYSIVCRASNICGVIVGCEFPLSVVSGTGNSLPVINCPSDITVRTCATCEVVNYPAPVVVNGVLAGCTPPSGTCFPVGATIVNCVASNACGVRDCKFTINVRAIPAVTIQCPSNIVITACSTGALVNYPAPTLVPAVDPTTVTVTCTPPSGSFFPLGTNGVRCCVVDECHRTNCCAFTVAVLPGNPCVKPPLNMVLWLPLDEPVGPVAANIVPGAPNGGHVNGPVPFLGQYVLNSLCFDGVNDFVRVPNYAGIVLSTSDLSIDAWVLRRPQDQGRRVIVSKVGNVAVAAGPRGYEYYLNNGVMNLALLGPVAQNFNSGIVVPPDNQWHHVTVTVRRGGNGAVRFYLDGAQVNAQFGAITAPIGSSAALYVGAGTSPAPNSFFRGYIDEVEIFNRVLTPAEIASLWNAHQAGKCKIKCSIPWDKTFPPGVNCITVTAQICNNSGVAQPIAWTAYGPLPISPASGSFNLGPYSCTNFPITLCRPTNNLPVGAQVIWNLSVSAGNNCPMVCMGSVINPGLVVVTNVPVGPVLIAGTNLTATVRIGLNGLPPGQPVRIRAIGPDMEPDLSTISLNGLPPGQPVIVGGGAIAPAALEIPLTIRFVQADAIGSYPILIEADLDGDGAFDTLESFDVENPVVAPPTIRIVRSAAGDQLIWENEGDGVGVLESAERVDGPWTEVPGAVPGFPLNLSGRMKFFRVAVPITD